MKEAQYEVINEMPGWLTIKDIGPWHRHWTITNDVEGVVQRLVQQGHLPAGRRLFYYSSEGELSEILVRDGRFVGFAPYNKTASPAATSEARKDSP